MFDMPYNKDVMDIQTLENALRLARRVPEDHGETTIILYDHAAPCIPFIEAEQK